MWQCEAFLTFWGGNAGSVGWHGWAGTYSSCTWEGASEHGCLGCWVEARDWSVWSADSRPRLGAASGHGRSVGCPGWWPLGPRRSPSPAGSWKSSPPHPAGCHNPSPFALRDEEKDPKQCNVNEVIERNRFFSMHHALTAVTDLSVWKGQQGWVQRMLGVA